MFERLSDIPVLVWVSVGLVAVAAGRYVQLWLRRRGNSEVEQASLRGLRLLYNGLAAFAKFNGDALPDSLEGEAWAFARGYAFRPVPRWGFDGRLVLAYDREPRHRLIEFPRLGPGRAALLGTGKIVVMSEPQLEQLMKADNRLRESLGLEPLVCGANP